MDNYREVELLAQKTVGDSGTETIDINVDAPITELSVKFGLTNAGAQSDDVPPECAVSKIELVDGGQVYFSLSGRELTAMAWYDKGYWPAHNYSEVANESQWVEWPFQFGRFIGDEQYAFSPIRLLNPQLKVTWAKNALHLTNVCTLEVNAKTMQGVTAPSKALLTKVIRSWSSAAAGIEEVDLPTDYPFRRLYWRNYSVGGWIGALWTQFRLECDVGKLIVFDMTHLEMLNLMEREWRQAEYAEYIEVDDWVMHYSHLGTCVSGAVLPFSAGCIGSASTTLPGYVRMIARDYDGAQMSDVKFDVTFRGLVPEYTYCYPFGRPDDPATWFDVSKYGSVKLKITEALAGGVASVFVQQPVPLP